MAVAKARAAGGSAAATLLPRMGLRAALKWKSPATAKV